ncbi:META domain-containing protein [Caldithrix abyssi]|nr:META domain-containing protein [Caldithrix abyssi]
MKTRILNVFGSIILFGLTACTDPVDDKPLVDTKWNLQSFEIIGEGKSDIGSQAIGLKFTKDGRVEGESRTIKGDLAVPGNSYGGIYEIGLDDSISIKLTSTTFVGLPAESRFLEYYQGLRNASTYEIAGDKLRIFYDGGTRTLNLKDE